MYEYLSGTLASLHADYIVLDVHGIGYRLFISKLSPCHGMGEGTKVKLWIEEIIREDSHTLFAFSSKEERELFLLLQNVSGIGPKTAINILGSATPSELAQAIFYKDVKMLSSFHGIGKKTAERLAVELHDKASELLKTTSSLSSHETRLAQDALQALQTLGFTPQEAKKAVTSALQNKPSISRVEDLVQAALSSKR